MIDNPQVREGDLVPHYIKVGDGNGKKAKLVAKTLIRLSCSREGCSSRVWVDWKPDADPTTFGLPHECYACGAPLHREWGAGQLAFVPEAEFGISEPHTGDIVEIQHVGTEDLPTNWAEHITADVSALDPTKPGRPSSLPEPSEEHYAPTEDLPANTDDDPDDA